MMNSKMRAYLRELGHALHPVVMVGKGSIDERVIATLDRALTDHELVKVKFQSQKEQVRALSDVLAESTTSDVVGMVGFTALFYRRNKGPEHRIIIPRHLLAD